MNETPWVNWQQFASLNEEETKRAQEDRDRAREDEKSNFDRLMAQFSDKAWNQGSQRGFRGVEKVTGYQDVIKARDEAMKPKPQIAGAAWESMLDPSKNNPYTSPWADLDKRMGQISQQAEYNQRQADQRAKQEAEAVAKAEQKRLNDAAEKEKARKEGIKKVEADIKFGHSLDSFESEIKDQLPKIKYQMDLDQAQGNFNPLLREQYVAQMVQKYKLDISDPRLRALIAKYGLNLEFVDRSMPSNYNK